MTSNMRRLEEEDKKVFENVVEKGLGAYYEEANADTKMDLAPLMEEMQQRMRGFGGRTKVRPHARNTPGSRVE